MHERGPEGLSTADLLGMPRGIIGGLIVERAEPVRVGTYKERWQRDVRLWSAVTDGLHAAAQGQQPQRRVERLPSWLVASVRDRLRHHEIYWLRNDFVVARLLELVGLAEFEPDDDYVISMLTGLVSAQSWEDQTWKDPVVWFQHDPELIDRGYWRAYEIEGQGALSLRVNDDHPGAANWREATRRMIEEGLVTRGQVITACLEALDRDFTSAASQWFVRMLTDLELTDDELVELQPVVRRHLDHRAAAVVRNAIGWMERLDRQRLLDDEATAPALEAAVLVPTKITAMAGLRLLDKIRVRTPSANVVPAARAGLGHRHTDVQRAAARLLIAAGAATQLADDADLLDPSVQHEFGLHPTPDESLLDTTMVDSALAASPASWWPVTPHDLAERLAALLERAQDPFELELVLDQLAQIGKTDLLHPLAKRAHTVVTANEFHRLEQQLAGLVLASCGTPVSPAVPEMPWARFLHRRLTEVKQILDEASPPGVRLATPTDPSGWLDPVEFVHRLSRADLTVSYADLIAGLLRLAPDNRAEALRLWRKASPAVHPQIEQVVRHALGEEANRDQALADNALWVAASRARSALQDDPLLIQNGLTGAGQGRRLDPAVTLEANPRLSSRFGEHDHWDLHITYPYACTPAAFSASSRESWWTKSRPWDTNQPTAVGDLSSRDAWNSPGWLDATWLAWHGLIWPADAEHYTSVVVIPTYVSRQWSTPDRTTIEILVALRRHPGRIGPTAAATVALAMTGGTVETRIHAADTIIDLISRERMATNDLAAALVTTAPAAILTRWAHTLQQVAAAGHSEIAIQLLIRVLPALARDRSGLQALLDLLHQELLRTNGTITDPHLRNYLTQVTGSSKAARSARAILAL